MFGIATEITVRLEPMPASVRTLLADFPTVRARERGGLRRSSPPGSCRRRMEMMDQACVAAVEASIYAAGYPTDAAAVLLVELDGQADAVEAEAGHRAARSSASAAPATVRSASSAGRPRAALAGPEEGVRRHGADRARPRGAGRGGAPLRAARHHGPDRRDPRPPPAQHQQRLPRGRRQPAPQHLLRPPRPGRRRTGCTSACREIMAACVEAGGSITGEHGVGSDKLDYMPWIFDAETLGAMRAVRRVFDPAERANPGKVVPVHACREWRAAAAAPMSDVVSRPAPRAARHQRRRARRRTGCPRATPDTRRRALAGLPAGPRGGLEDPGRGSGHLAPGRRAGRSRGEHPRRSTRCVSVSPADLVATVQAGTPLEALRRRLADEGMWLAIDPPGRPERSLGSVIATATAGPLRHGFGPVRDHVLGCTVATGDGRLVKAGGRVVKNVAGYDLTKLQVGGFGGFGIIAEVHLRLRALPRADVTLVARGTRDTLTSAARDADGAPSWCRRALELLSPALAAEADWVLAARFVGTDAAVQARRAAARARSPSSSGSRCRRTARRRSGAWPRAAARAARSRSGSASWATAWTTPSTSWRTTWTSISSPPAPDSGMIRWTGDAPVERLRASAAPPPPARSP